jgi:hypothetical protein
MGNPGLSKFSVISSCFSSLALPLKYFSAASLTNWIALALPSATFIAASLSPSAS